MKLFRSTRRALLGISKWRLDARGLPHRHLIEYAASRGLPRGYGRLADPDENMGVIGLAGAHPQPSARSAVENAAIKLEVVVDNRAEGNQLASHLNPRALTRTLRSVGVNCIPISSALQAIRICGPCAINKAA